MTNVTNIPLNKLVSWKGNVRRTKGCDTALAELAASIAAHGLLQSLVVRKDKRGKYAVVAGARRHAALSLLASEGKIEPNHAVPCQVVSQEAAGTEISLAENAVRENMHPADEFEAFRYLVDGGMSVADIAARFGIAESTVEKRLRLARVSPVIIEAYREDELSLQCVMAFAVTDNREEQERLWNEAPEWLKDNPRAIRSALTEHEITGTDRRVQFVTLKAYEKAGGIVRRDLFSEGDKGVFIGDAVLLETLVRKKLEKIAKAVRKEGWKWVEVVPVFSYDDDARFETRNAETVTLLADEEKELAAIEKEIDESYNIEGDLTAEQQARIDALSQRMDELTYEREEFWPEEVLAIAGSVVSVGHDGETEISRGLVRPEDAPAKPSRPPKSGDGEDTKGPANGLPSALIESLTGQRSAAISAALIGNPDVALAATVHALALPVFHKHSRDTSLGIDVSPQSFSRVEGSKALETIEQVRSKWQERLPNDPADLWNWCLKQLPETLMELLAFCTAVSVDATESKRTPSGGGRIGHARALAKSLELDMTGWFTPTAKNYFGRVTKPQILSALQEAKGVPTAPAWANMKKADLAALAEREMAESRWLPELLRTPELISA